MSGIFFAAILFSPVLVAASLDGHVTDAAGHPIRKAGVTLRGGSPPSAYSTATDTDGSFAFSELNPGTYTLSVDRAGYIGKQYRTSPHETVSTIALTAGQHLTDVNLALLRAVTISGVVRDGDGDPVANVPVRLLQRTLRSVPDLMLERSVSTDASGKYTFPDLPPGRHYVSAGAGDGKVLSTLGMRVNNGPASGPPAEYYANTWYADARDQSGAKALQVLQDDLQGVDIRLLKTPAFLVTGKVTGAVPPDFPDQCQVVLTPVDHPMAGLNTVDGVRANITKDGLFDFRGARFPPGDYLLFVTTMSRGRPSLLVSRPLEIGNRDIDDAVLDLQPLVGLRGSVALEGEARTDFSALPGNPPPTMTTQVSLRLVGGPEGSPGMSSDIRSGIGSDGSFTLAAIAPGAYEVRVSGLPGTWVKSVRLGALESARSRIEITETNAAAPLQITVARSTGRIAGIVVDDRGNPVGRGTLILLRDQPGPNSVTMLSGVGEDGRFMLPPVPPGTYRAYAWEDIVDAQRYDPDLLKAWESSSVTVTVKENGSEEITLRQIPSQEAR